jgi:signal transduction histidine kinase
VILSLSLAAVVFAIDCSLPLGVASAVPYTFAVLLALQAPDKRIGPAVAVLCALLTFVKFFLFPERGSTELWKVVVNRFLALFTIGMTAFLGVKRRRAEEERQEAEQRTRLHLADLAHMGRVKTAGQLATSLAHELNQPLAAILLQADVALATARQHPQLPQGIRDPLEEIAEQAQRAAAVVRTVRNLVLKAEPQHAPLRVNDLVGEVARLIDTQARQARLQLELQPAAADPIVLGDRIQIEQVLLNLLQNAVDAVAAAPAGERRVCVSVDLDTKEQQVMVRVTDTGIGLAAEDVERVFERFYSTKPSGMGMGLALSRTIVEAHGGRLWAETGASGATFLFSLPLAAEK